MHPEILDLRKEAFSLVDSDPGWQFLAKSGKGTVFRGAVRSGAITDPDLILKTTLRLDLEISVSAGGRMPFYFRLSPDFPPKIKLFPETS
jgi:hypothetical protein